MAAALPTVSIGTQSIMVVFACPVVTSMATRTSSSIGRIWPGHCFAVTRVTDIATEIATMISRISARYMAVVCYRQPAVGCMAIIALNSSHEMPSGLASGNRTVMAGVTVPGDAGVIEGHGGPCSGGGMTVIALGRGRHMSGRHACGEIAVVAVGAGAGHTAMAESHIQPVAGGQVADVALFRRRYVVGRLARGQCAIMAI